MKLKKTDTSSGRERFIDVRLHDKIKSVIRGLGL
jgi:hypothetical protein